MGHINYTINKKNFKHIIEFERYKIEAWLKAKKNVQFIADELNKDRRTIEREIKIGTVSLQNSDLTYRREYCADTAQMIRIKNSSSKGRCLKIGKDHALVSHIESKIKDEKYSPDAVIGEIKQKGIIFETSICTKTVYNYIDKEVFLNITNKDLLIKKNGTKRKISKVKVAMKNIKGTSIEERPDHIEKREELGHWEMDCVVGKQEGKSTSLLVLSERASRKELVFKIDTKTQINVEKVIDKLEKVYKKKFKEVFKSITVDNGSEFLNFEGIENSKLSVGTKRTKVYYAHAYASWERGTNENINKMIRRFIPKGTDISKYTEKEIKRIEYWINTYPRRIFGYKTANEIYKEMAS